MMNALADMAPQWRIMVGGWADDEFFDYEHRLSSQKALSYAPIWNGVNKIAGHVAQLPICVYKRLEQGADRDRKHNIHRLMRRPNAYQTPMVFRELIATHSLLDGNGRAAIVREGGRASELIPLDPDCTVTLMIQGVKVHGTRPSKDDRLRLFFPSIDRTEEGLILLDDSDVMHVLGLSLDGVNGLALRKIAKRNIGASINSEKRLSKQMESGFSGSLMLEAPNGVFRNQKDAEEFLDAFEKRHNSPDKAGKTGMLREGIKANIIAMNNKDAEMIENRRFQRQDAALYLGLESILGDDASVSYNSLEQKNLAYLMNCLNKWLKRWEEEMEYKLLPRRQFDNESHYIRFNTAALLKSDYKTSVESLALAIGATMMSPNEAREKLDMNPRPGGDAFTNPAITPGEAAKPAREEPPTDRARNALLANLISTEANRVKQGAEKAGNFLQWVDNFYAKHWEANLADKLEEIGMDRDAASVHCAESRRRLLEVSDYSQADNLAANVAKCVSDWKNRANLIGVVNV